MILQIIGIIIIVIILLKKIFKKNDQIQKKTITFDKKKRRIKFNDKVQINIIPNILNVCKKDELWYNRNDYERFWRNKNKIK